MRYFALWAMGVPITGLILMKVFGILWISRRHSYTEF